MGDVEMSFHIFLTFIIIGLSNSLPDKPCDRIQIGKQWYEKEILWRDPGKPYNLNVHKPTNILFFSFAAPETFSDVDFQLVNLNLDTKEYQNVPGIKGGCATAIDQINDEIYLGGSDGIYKYNMATKLADFYKEKDKNVWSLFHRHNLFYVSYPEQRLYMEIDGKFDIVKEFENIEIDQFYTTADGGVYFSNNTGLYTYNKTNQLSRVINDLITVREFAEDNNGTIYTCTNFGLFTLKGGELTKVSHLKNIYGLTFDRENNFVMSDDRRVMKLLKSDRGCNDNEHW